MTAASASLEGLPAQARPDGTDGPHGPDRRDGPAGEDLLLHPDPVLVADAATTECLLRCWVRETGRTRPSGGVLRVALGDGLCLTAPVRYWSPTGRHRFGAARLVAEIGTGGHPVDSVTIAALLARESGRAGGAAASRHTADLAARVADSARRTARFVAERREAPAAPEGTSPFLDAEQALILGHPLHPSPKSREGLGDAESAAYSPELRGAFRLHWVAVAREFVAADSATGESATEIVTRLRGTDASGAALPPGTAALPLHPWQARELMHHPRAQELLEQGVLHDLGPAGDPWQPTSSVRTVHQPGSPWMLKLSLGLRITNSKRENLRKELRRGVEVHRLLEAGLGAELRAAHRGFDILRDPAWIGADLPAADPRPASALTGIGAGFSAGAAVGAPAPSPLPALDTVVRQSPFGAADRALCTAGLIAERPWLDPGTGTAARSRLGETLHRLCALSGRPLAAVADEWFRRYLRAVALPLLWLDGTAGIALEAHHQNSLVLLDQDGWPQGGRYRDNQGYYFRESRAAELDARLAGAGKESDTFVPDAVADERFCYYLGVNHLFGLIGAFGAQGLADESALLASLRAFLGSAAAGATGSSLPGLLLDSPSLRCKANLLTRLHGLDELVGPVDGQSVYVTVTNPLASAAAGGPA